MATLTIRDLPADIVARIKETAAHRGVSMEQEVRDLLHSRYGAREQVLADIRRRWESTPPATADEIDAWRTRGRR